MAEIPTDTKILIVDDFLTVRRAVRNILEQLGFTEILEAADGQAALETLQEERVDLIISDWNMPNLCGPELLKAIRAVEELSSIPFLMLTSYSNCEEGQKALTEGRADVLPRPFNSDTLKEKLSELWQ